jgi:adenylate cyclase
MSDDELVLAATVLGVISTGLGVMLLTAQDRSRTTLGIGGVYLFVGVAIPLGFHLGGEVDAGSLWLARLQGLCEAAALAMAAVYLDGMLSTAKTSPTTERRLRRLVRVGLGLAVWFALAGLLLPEARLNDFEYRVLDTAYYDTFGFWFFLISWLVVALVFMYGYLLLMREQLDPGERVRSTATLIASPLLIATTVAPRPAAVVCGVISMLVTLYGQFRFAVARGERGAFLSRFLSPQVAEQVRTEGLTAVMQPAEHELTVVACDLRGFTSYADAVPSQAVIDLLGEYYDAVGTAVAEVKGTIKDYAGDGVLILVGAPLPLPDHATAGLTLARRIHEVTAPVLDRWATTAHPLGIGVGVATGRVTVGAIGSSGRMEYTAVGTPVNLAARLCSRAAAGESLIDKRTADEASSSDVVPRDVVEVKGLNVAVPIFELRPAGGVVD